MPETIELLLKELKLPTLARHYQSHQQQALEKGYGHIRYLSGELCEQEAADRYQKRVQNGIERRIYRLAKALTASIWRSCHPAFSKRSSV